MALDDAEDSHADVMTKGGPPPPPSNRGRPVYERERAEWQKREHSSGMESVG